MLFRKNEPKRLRPLSVCDQTCRAEAVRDRMLTSVAERMRV